MGEDAAVKPSQVYVGRGEVGKPDQWGHVVHKKDVGRIKHVGIAQVAAEQINNTYGNNENPKVRTRDINKFLKGAKGSEHSLDPFHASSFSILEERAEAKKDSLTGLLHHKAFFRELESLLKNGNKIGVIRADLDKFSWLNDALGGHSVGDLYLQVIARRLFNGVQLTDVVGRPGGDEFMLIINHEISGQDFKRVAGRIAESLMGKDTLGETLNILLNSDEEVKLANGKMEDRRTFAFRQVCQKMLDLYDNRIVDEKTKMTAQEYFITHMRGSWDSKNQFLDNIRAIHPEFIQEMRDYAAETRVNDEMGHDRVYQRHFERDFRNVLYKAIPDMGASLSATWVDDPTNRSAQGITEALDDAVYKVKGQGGNNILFI